ncbi:ABC transporter ATP-binding protein [Candidatus Saccharibacteria bacterium]|nr:ABC transporter ATP-binding protein [Candidatus Saccharibacteria bacterium]
MRFLKPYWWQVILLILAMGAQVWTTLQLPALMANIINDGIVTGNTDYIVQAGWQMIGLAIVSAICSFVASYLSAAVGANYARDLRFAVFEKVISLNLEDLKNFNTASLTNRTTNDINQVQNAVMMILSMMLRAPIFCILALVMAIQTAPDMTWIIAVGVTAILLTVIIIMVTVIPKFKLFQKMIDRVTLLTRENLTGLKVIRAFNNEEAEKKKFVQANDELTRLIMFVEKIMKLTNPLINVIFNGTTLLCVYIGITLLSKDFAYLGDMSAFAQYVAQVMMSFLMLSILFVMLPRANVSAGRINEVLNTKTRIHWKEQTNGVPEKTPSVEFKNVDFRYAEADGKVLDNISFKAVAGQTTAFIGSTGSGKSTLVNLVPRFYEPTHGEILINGVNIKDYKQDDLMQKIGFVPQRGMLFSGTVESNIKFGAPNATDAQVRQSAKIAQADGFIEKMPKKYKAHIAQGGSNVSGGQKQRISIARAICKNPDIFVFDDSFSALDMKTDKKLREALVPITRNAVVLVVAQRVSTIKNAEQIIVLDNGKIAGKGTHAKLLCNCKVYQDIVKSQLSDAEYESELKLAQKQKASSMDNIDGRTVLKEAYA